MKKLIIFLIGLTAARVVEAQTKTKPANSAKNITYYNASPGEAALQIELSIDSSTKWIDQFNILPNRPHDNYVFLNGTKKVVIATHPRQYQNFKNFRYNIIQDDSIYLVTNAIVNVGKDYNISANYNREIILGEFDVQNKKLAIESYDINQRHKVSTTIIYSKIIKPADISMTFLWVASSGVTGHDLKDGFKLKINDGKETVTGIRLAIKPTDLPFLYHVYVKSLASGKMLPVSNNWLYGFGTDEGVEVPSLQIEASFFSEPGDYEIVIIPQLPSHNKSKEFVGKATTMRFTVLKPDTVYSAKEIWIIALGIIMIAVVIILYNKRKNQQRFNEQQKEKDLAQVQLSAVRSQLNPHFLFNALAGIQNLMNQNETDQANRYLTKFARLTRNVLKSNELISITDETALLDDYLQMEQLRFGFTYDIETGNDVDAANTEIPAMLLQPFVENAVKHGIADLGADGKINIRITKSNKDLILTIADNGSGFDTTKHAEGLGISLSEKRIALLNKIYTQAPVSLDIKSGSTGTEIKLTLTQWL